MSCEVSSVQGSGKLMTPGEGKPLTKRSAKSPMSQSPWQSKALGSDVPAPPTPTPPPSCSLMCLNGLYSSKCSGSCGEGRMSRFITCRNQEGKVISDSQCDPATKPLAVHPCGDKNCPAHWVEQEWDQVKPRPAPCPQHSFLPHVPQELVGARFPWQSKAV